MRSVARKLVLVGYVLLPLPAAGEIYECVEPGGTKLFTSDAKEATAKGCKVMKLGPPNTVSTAKPGFPGQSPAKTGTPAPKDFPKVDQDTQRQRDIDRRRILEQELANEQKLLEQARSELAVQDSMRLGSERNYQRVLDRLEPYQRKVKLHEDNIANLRRELAGSR